MGLNDLAPTTGWPTPDAGAHNTSDSTFMERRRKAAEKHGNNGFGLTLGMAAQTAGWPSPMAGTPTQKGYNEAGNTDSGRKTVALAPWPTPNATDGSKAPEKFAGGNPSLPAAAKLAGWVSPTERDHARGTKPPRSHDTGVPLSQQVGWATPRVTTNGGNGNPTRATDGKARLEDQVLGATSSTSDASTEKPARFRLNPYFSLWLMGFPKRWMDLAPSRASVRSGARAMRLFPE